MVALAALVVWDATQTGGSAPGTASPSTLASLEDMAVLSEDTPGASDPAPDFVVSTFDGASFALGDHLAEDGRPVVLNLWASWCFPCRAEMPAIDAFATANPDVLVIGVAVQDDPVAAKAFADEIGVGYPLAVDERDEVNRDYQPLGLPATFLISPEGDIVDRVFGGVTEESLTESIAPLRDG